MAKLHHGYETNAPEVMVISNQSILITLFQWEKANAHLYIYLDGIQ